MIKIVGSLSTKEEAEEIQQIAKIMVVNNRIEQIIEKYNQKCKIEDYIGRHKKEK